MENRRSHSLTGPLLSGNANNGTNAGSRYANTNNRATNANANYGFRLYREKDLRLCDPASWQKKLTRDGEGFPSRNGTLFDRFVSHYTLVEAAMKAQVGKRKSKQIQDFNKTFGENIQRLHDQLASGMDTPCQYRNMKVFEPKERNIMIAPFYPHRIIHQAIVMVMKDSWIGNLIDNTYACIKGRGIHACMFDVRDALAQDHAGTRYCLKMDVSKYFDSINHEVLKQLIRQELDDARLLHVIDNQIDSVPGGVGVPIGNLTSQYFANIYLTPLDHFCHEVFGLKYYFRYMDDVVMLHSDKAFLHHCRAEIENYLNDCLHLKLKRNWQVFPVASRQIDFVGYRLNHKGVMLRKKILTNFYKGVIKLAKSQRQIEVKHQLSSHYGWVKYVDKIHQQNIYKNAEIKQKVILN